MFLFRKVTENNNSVLTSSSSSGGCTSDDELIEKEPYCVVVEESDKSSVYSNKSDDGAKLKYGQGSFAFHSVKSHIVLQFNKMFLWRMVNMSSLYDSRDKQTDMDKLRTFFSFYMSNPCDVIIRVYPDKISYQLNNRAENVSTSRFCLTLLEAYNQLYMDTVRRYNTKERIDAMLLECAKILCVISRA
jgi:hypothetical protein